MLILPIRTPTKRLTTVERLSTLGVDLLPEQRQDLKIIAVCGLPRRLDKTAQQERHECGKDFINSTLVQDSAGLRSGPVNTITIFKAAATSIPQLYCVVQTVGNIKLRAGNAPNAELLRCRTPTDPEPGAQALMKSRRYSISTVQS